MLKKYHTIMLQINIQTDSIVSPLHSEHFEFKNLSSNMVQQELFAN